MTAQAVLLRLQFLAARAHVRRFTPHDLRRSFVGELLDTGADLTVRCSHLPDIAARPSPRVTTGDPKKQSETPPSYCMYPSWRRS